MWRLTYMIPDVLPVGIVAALAIFLMKKRIGSGRRCLVDAVFACYLLAVFSTTGIPTVKNLVFDPSFNFAPQNVDATDAALNAALFVPLGFLLPLMWREFRSLPRTALAGFALSLAIEALQIFTFRLTDVNDLLTNTLGALLGGLLAKPFLAKGAGGAGRRAAPELPALLGLSFGLTFFVQPFVADAIWNLIG